MVFLFTDFGATDLYVGQVHACLRRALPAGDAIIDLLHQAPAFDVVSSAHLLAALAREVAAGDVCLAVVDPGVGGTRDAVALRADGKWFVGPDNGLLSVIAARAQHVELYRIAWRPPMLSVSFHGRDLFAPVAARLVRDDLSMLTPKPKLDVEFGAADLGQIIYIDHYGNAFTGLRGAVPGEDRRLSAAGSSIAHAEVFGAAATGEPFWYVNSIGLVEIACNREPAAPRLGLRIGDAVRWQ